MYFKFPGCLFPFLLKGNDFQGVKQTCPWKRMYGARMCCHVCEDREAMLEGRAGEGQAPVRSLQIHAVLPRAVLYETVDSRCYVGFIYVKLSLFPYRA